VLAVRLVRAANTRSAARDEVLLRHVGHRDRELGLVVMECLEAPEPLGDEVAMVLDGVLLEDVRHGARILAALAKFNGVGDDRRVSDEPVQRALRDELDLVCLRVRAGRLARHGFLRLGPALVKLGAGGPSGALALEAVEVVLGPIESKQVLPLLTPDLTVAERLARLPPPASDAPTDLMGFLKDLIEDVDGEWRSTWLRACAIHSGTARGVLDQLNLGPARALGDPIIDELLVAASSGRSAPSTALEPPHEQP
jgi:hypothetical protein